jgi:hypothetical protein
MKKRYLLLMMMFVLGPIIGRAQSFAVTTGLQVNSFPAYLSDYSNPGIVYGSLLSTDERPVYPVLLKVEISGQGYLLKSKQGLSGGKYLELQQNQLVSLTGNDLIEIFDPNRLDFIGVSQSGFQNQVVKLPDGPVVISIIAYDVVLDKAVSNVASVSGMIQSNSPPQILDPIGEQNPQTPQNMLISWIPQHTGNFVTQYDIEIYEKNMDFSYDLIVNANAPFFSTTTMQTTYQMSELDPLLVQGQEYLIRVRARDDGGTAVFENEGWSEIEYFAYGLPGIAACYQAEANFCAAFCDFELATLVCQKAAYDIQIPKGSTLVAELNNLGIGSFDVFQVVAPVDDYGYCNVSLMVTAESLLDVPVSLFITSSSFSDHCVSEAEQGDGEPGFYAPGSGTPNNLGNELSFDFLICPENELDISCDPPADEGLSVIADHPIMAEFYWMEIPEQPTTAFQVQYRPNGGGEWLFLENIPAEDLMAYIGNLSGGEVYEARVRAVCGEQLISDWSGIIEFNTTCIIPNAVWVTGKGR